MSRVSRKRERAAPAEFPFQVGDQCEQLWTVRNYQHTRHPVEILAIYPDKRCVTVRCLAFEDEPPHEKQSFKGWGPVRAADPNVKYAVGDEVHFRMFGRRVYGKKVDGVVGDQEGVWVDGRIVQVDLENGRYLVQHFDWDRQDEVDEPRTVRWVPRRHLRIGDN